MTTKEKLEQAIKSMEVARKEWNETNDSLRRGVELFLQKR